MKQDTQPRIITGKIIWHAYAKHRVTGQHETSGPFEAAFIAINYIDHHYPERDWIVKVIGKQEKVAV